jgi:multimeric flavodoxin WrbA
MKALVLSCTLKKSPEPSNCEALARIMMDEFGHLGIESQLVRLADLHIPPGVQTDMGAGDEWPRIHEELLQARIVVFATPTWVGRPSSLAQRAMERMDAMITEMRQGVPVAYGKVGGVVVTGNEDGAHHVVSEICGGLGDIGFTIPPQASTYWNKGPGPGADYLDTEYRHDWSEKTGRQAARNLVKVAQALQAVKFEYDE